MGFYNLSREERVKKVQQVESDLFLGFTDNKVSRFLKYFADDDTYIRKTAYQGIGKLYEKEPQLRPTILLSLEKLLSEKSHHIRQTSINAAGEIGMKYFESIEALFDKGLFDQHHVVRNAVVGSIKKMGAKNPQPVLRWAKKYLNHPDKEIRREICHGIELRGRTHPEDILPLLKQLQYDETGRVRNMLIHVLGQISYKKGCLPKVVEHLKDWNNKDLVAKAIEEIIDVHGRYKAFAALTRIQAKKYIDDYL